MSLTMGTGPFGHAPAGRANVELPREDLIYVEPSPRRIRAVLGGETVLDSHRAQLLLRHGALSRYFVPRADVRLDRLGDVEPVEPPAGAPGLADHVALPWDAMDAWLEEDDEQLAHAPDPYHRVDVRATSRHVRISLDGRPLAESRRAMMVFETGLPVRWYLPREDVTAPLAPSELRTACAYKGRASYLSLAEPERPNLAWTYPDPRPEVARLRDRVAFFDEQVDVEVDGERLQRPPTPWADPRWFERPGPER